MACVEPGPSAPEHLSLGISQPGMEPRQAASSAAQPLRRPSPSASDLLEDWALERVLISLAAISPAPQPQGELGAVPQQHRGIAGALWVQEGKEAVRQLNKAALVDKQWNAISRSKELWQELFDELLTHGRYLPESIKIMRNYSPRNAFISALKDASRTSITLDELCKFSWSFRFKQMAGPEWIANDPYWQGEDARSLDFQPDGEMSWNPEVAPDMQIWWRWGNAQRREPGAGSPCSSVRVTVSGSDVPSYVISRHPVNNGFLMQSCWVLLTSFKMPKQGGDPLIEDEALQVRYEDQSAEALQYNIGVGSGDDTEVTIEAELEDDRVIINAGGQTVLVPRDVGVALVTAGLPGNAVLQLLRMIVGSGEEEEQEEEDMAAAPQELHGEQQHREVEQDQTTKDDEIGD